MIRWLWFEKKKPVLTLCFHNLMKIEMNVNLWSVGHKNTRIDGKKCFRYFIDCSLGKKEQSHLHAHIFVYSDVYLNDSEKDDDCFCMWNTWPTVKKAGFVRCTKNTKWGGNVPSFALFSGWFHVFGSIFKLNYWISSIWSNMHVYSSLFIVVQAHADFISECEHPCDCGCCMWCTVYICMAFFWGSVHS